MQAIRINDLYRNLKKVEEYYSKNIISRSLTNGKEYFFVPRWNLLNAVMEKYVKEHENEGFDPKLVTLLSIKITTALKGLIFSSDEAKIIELS